jgi:hypothetical protein
MARLYEGLFISYLLSPVSAVKTLARAYPPTQEHHDYATYDIRHIREGASHPFQAIPGGAFGAHLGAEQPGKNRGYIRSGIRVPRGARILYRIP